MSYLLPLRTGPTRVLFLQQPRSKHEHRSCTRSHHNYCLATLRLNSLTSTTNVFQPFCIIFRVILLVCPLQDLICMIHDAATVCICYTVCVALKHSTGNFVMNIYHTIFVISLVFVCVNNFLVCLFPFQSYELVSIFFIKNNVRLNRSLIGYFYSAFFRFLETALGVILFLQIS